MASFNRVILMGNLTRDPQLKYLPSQTAVAEFGLAMSRKFKTASGEDREEVCFVDCAAFAKTGELINQYFQKGKPIMIEGRLKYDSWEDKQGGGKRSKLSVVIESFQFVGTRDGGGGGGGGRGADGGGGEGGEAPPRAPARTAAPPRGRAGPAQAPPAEDSPIGEDQQFKEDDIPF
jgi:single-strand DNA-binding protein